jgi:sugar transport protein
VLSRFSSGPLPGVSLCKCDRVILAQFTIGRPLIPPSQYFIQFGAAQVGGGPSDVNQPTSAFRIPWGAQTVPAVILFVGLFFMPYSPRWLASHDRWEEAIEVLAGVHGGGNTNHPKVLAQYQEIVDALHQEREESTTSFAALVEPRMFKRVALGMSIQM